MLNSGSSFDVPAMAMPRGADEAFPPLPVMAVPTGETPATPPMPA